MSRDGILILKITLKKIKKRWNCLSSKTNYYCYPRAFEVIDAENEIFKLDSQEKRALTLVLKKTVFFIKRCFSNQIAGITENEISHGYLIAAGCLFTTKEFVNEIPYDDKLYFYGEELAICFAHLQGDLAYFIPPMYLFIIFIMLLVI